MEKSARLSGEREYNSKDPFVSSMFTYSVVVVVVVVVFLQRFLQFRQTRDTADFVFMRR